MKIYSMNDVVFTDIARLLMAKYGKDAAFDKCVVVLGYNLPQCTPESVRAKFPGHRIIIYQLEQLFNGSKWATQHAYNWLKTADEIWDYDLDNIEWLHKSGFRPKFMPLFFSDALREIEHVEKDIDVLFYGSPTQRRMQFMSYWMMKSCFKYTTVFATGVQGEKLQHFIGRSKIILNLHAFDNDSRQEQVRLFYPIINNCCVVSEASHRNYFGKSIVECKTLKEIPDTLHGLLDSGDWEKIAKSAAETYRKHCDERK